MYLNSLNPQKTIFPLLGIIFFITLSTISCKREVYNIETVNDNYFPLETGKYCIYEVDYVSYNDFSGTIDTSKYFIKELIGNSDTDNSGNLYYRLERYTKQTLNDPGWQFAEVWAIQHQDGKSYRIEDNQRYINIDFPLFYGKEWNGLTHIRKDTFISITGGTIDVYKDWENFKITSLNQPELIAGTTYDSVMTILRADKTNNIERRYSIEKYAKNIGLVFKQDSILDTQCNGNLAACAGLPWSEKAEKGYIQTYKLVETNW